ncbi:MAG TPA: protein-L-isoaspartate(D-aspartate) O-methyltransferase, partial [Planctomycetes bacterium]|nr:protein-L-isoaspartate(D-aspartate) O-methyltransferase [Planctomycetota bacterium]
MVERDVRTRGISDPRVLAAMERVPREKFVQPLDRGEAYADHPLAIGMGQTISQPYIVAYMSEALKLQGGERVLEIGTGSGYQAAVLAEIAGEVHTVERIGELSERACSVISKLGYRNVFFYVADGTAGWPENAPYDAIIITAAAPDVPAALYDQLAPGGRIVAPVGPRACQQLVRITAGRNGAPEKEKLIACIFVPLIGEAG